LAENKLTNWRQRLFYTTRDDRSHLTLVANNLILHLHPINVPAKALRFTYTWGLGGMSAILMLMLAFTGLLLMFRYDARVDYAYISIQQLESSVAFGSLLRGIHHWSANLLVITTFLHLLRVFFTGSFKRGRTANWLIGIALLLLVLGANFTGYLLPWDQLAYWAITVSTSLLTYLPLVGNTLRNLLLGGPAVGQGALSNFYAIHVVVIPLLLISISLYHFWKVRKNGGISQPLAEPGERTERKTTIPHLVEREAAVALLVFAGVVIWAMLRPSPLGELANPFDSPNPAKAAWYFLGLQELLLHMQPLAAIAILCIVLAALALVPYWDRDPRDIGIYFRSAAGRWSALIGSLLGFVLVPLIVILDEYRLNLSTWLPSWPAGITGGLIPLLASLATLALVYFSLRRVVRTRGQHANHSEAVLGLFTFVIASLVMLTIVGIFFRGPNMALVLPF
jgi:quinol-cytochrome oxidoreductase complex cytochrome b subunit